MDETTLRHAEVSLRAAMLSADAKALQDCLSPQLVFVGPDGQSQGRDEDIMRYRSGRLRVRALDTDVALAVVHGDMGITVVRANVAWCLDGAQFEGCYEYTRTWAWMEERWQVLSAIYREATSHQFMPHLADDVFFV